MEGNEYVFSRGMESTRGTLERWNESPWPTLRGWLLLSYGIAIALLAATWFFASVITPDPTPVDIPGLYGQEGVNNVLGVLFRNSIVLALHATACVAGFIAGASMPIAAAQRTGFSRWVHVRAAQFAIFFVSAVTLFSLSTQALGLGFQGATIAFQLGLSPGELMVTVLPHALPELVALFLPLAAWLIASRRGEWDQLLAATLVTVLVAIPALVSAALIEVYLWPHILEAFSPYV